jgi:hypothetical protein
MQPQAQRAKVVNKARTRQFDVYVGRPSKWGNPFRIGPDGTREEVIAKYEAWLLARPDLMAALGELRGKVLACWCAPLPCHADVLARLADRGPRPVEATPSEGPR